MTFADFNLNKGLWSALDDMGISQPTPIQVKTFSPIMSGRDIIGIAQTGTGKTLAYLLPSLRLWKFSKNIFPQILIIVPTRELVAQVVEEVEKLTEYMNVVTVGVYGGANIKGQIDQVSMGLDVLVGTPGRLLDLAKKGAVSLKATKRVIVDEVDEMMNLGFRHQITSIFDMLPAKRQNLLFSATMTDDIEKLIEEFFDFPTKIEAAPTGTPLEQITQSKYNTPNFKSKVALLMHLLNTDPSMDKVMIFSATKKLADLLYARIEDHFVDQVGIIHSNKSQNMRFNAVNRFRDGSFRIIIATDIIARGLDIAEVSHVINFDIPTVAEDYMHRIGRTGRADMDGIAYSFVTESDQAYMTDAETLMNMVVPTTEFPTEVEFNDELEPHELPVYRMPRLDVTHTPSGPAFHDKLEKNKKVNRKVRHVDLMKKKYGKPKSRGKKVKARKRKK